MKHLKGCFIPNKKKRTPAYVNIIQENKFMHCIDQECSEPWFKHFSMIDLVVRVMPSLAWDRYVPKSVLRGQSRFSSKFTWKNN